MSTNQKAVVSRIHFGPPDQEWPPEIKQLFREAHQKVRQLYMEVYNGQHKKESVDRLIELGTIICSEIEILWRNPEYRPFVEGSSRGRYFFPLLHTNLIETPGRCADEMKKKLPLHRAPGHEKGKNGKGKRGRKTLDDLLNREVEYFVLGVVNPGMLRTENPDAYTQIDVIDDKTRRRLLTPAGLKDLGEWPEAFVEIYIRPHRPDLLSDDGTGKFSELAKERFLEFQAKNPNEKNFTSSPWRAFKTLVTERLRKFKPLIKSAIQPI